MILYTMSKLLTLVGSNYQKCLIYMRTPVNLHQTITNRQLTILSINVCKYVHHVGRYLYIALWDIK